MYPFLMQNFEITFLFPTDGNTDRSQSVPFQFEAESLDDAKRQADVMIEQRSLLHRTVSVAILTTTEDHVMEVTRWVRDGGWMDA